MEAEWIGEARRSWVLEIRTGFEGGLALSCFIPYYLGIISVVSDAETGLSERSLGVDIQAMDFLVYIWAIEDVFKCFA